MFWVDRAASLQVALPFKSATSEFSCLVCGQPRYGRPAQRREGPIQPGTESDCAAEPTPLTRYTVLTAKMKLES